MPYTIQPLKTAIEIKPFGTSLDPVVRQLQSFDYNPDRAWLQAAGRNVRGTISGGPSLTRFLEFGNEQKYLPVAPRPALTTAVLPDTAAFYRRQLGAIDFAAIDPFSTLNQVADQGQQAVGGDPFGALRGIESFLGGKDIDLFGMGPSGAPARAADYALAFPLAVLKHLGGVDLSGALPRGKQDDDPYYRLHADPRYWQTVKVADDAQMFQMARDYASQFVGAEANAYVVEQLHAQFVRDREIALGLSSGSPRTDYVAKQTLQRQMQLSGNALTASRLLSDVGTRATGLPVQELVAIIPFFGTEIAAAIDPITPETEKAWRAMSDQQRTDLLGMTGLKVMGTDLIAALPAFSALGTVLQVARAGGGMTKLLASSYDALLRASSWTAMAGLTAATANWAASAYSPEYAAGLGREIDLARPISGSIVAGEINMLGYFASGTWGAYGVARVGSRILSKALKPGVSRLIKGIGLPETPMYQYGLGGAPMSDLAASTGIPISALRLSTIRLHTSYAVHLVRKPLVEMFEAVARGAKILGHPELDELSIAERLAFASDELVTGLTNAHSSIRGVFDLLNAARKSPALFASEQARRVENLISTHARKIHEDMGEMFMRDYGVEWVTRQSGAYTEAAIKGTVKARLDRMGYDFGAIEGQIHGEDNWAKMLRIVHQYEFDRANGELAAAFEVPGVPESREAGRIALVDAHHLFLDMADEAIPAIRASTDLAASRAIIRDLIERTPEAERWYARNFRPRGAGRTVIKSMDTVNPESFVKWLEDIRPSLLRRRMQAAVGATTADLPLNAFHRRLADDGLWNLAFKPTNDAGEFVSYVHTREGDVFQTPWLDYPMSTLDNIEIGNRGRLMTKYDAIFRSFRTWRVAEFQRGLLFRNLTGGKYDLDATPAQIEDFNQDVMNLAAEYSVQPQTLGAVSIGSVGVGRAWADRLNAVAAKHFGDGPYLTKSGTTVAINWQEIVADSYRQSLKLNFTAGLTSYMKSHFGPIGAAAALWADVGYINFRFGLSPLFKLGEVEETIQLNAMAGVNPFGDPTITQLFMRQGVAENHGVLTQEQAYDQLLLGTGKQAPIERQARAYGFMSLRAPETLATKQARAKLQMEAEAHATFAKPEAEIQAAYDAGAIARGQQLNRDVGIARGGTIESGGAMRANAPLLGPNEGFSPEVMALFKKPSVKVDLSLNTPPPEHLVNAELAGLVDDAGNVVRGNEERVIELQNILGEYEAARAFRSEVNALPLAPDKEGLLTQLRQTVREDGREPFAGLEERHARIVEALAALDNAQVPPGGFADNIADIPGTPEFLISNINQVDPSILRPVAGERPTLGQQVKRAVATGRNPIPFKQQQALLYRIEKLRRDFPSLIRASGLDGFEAVMHELKVPERNWLPFLMEDRELAQAFSSSGHPDDLIKLMAHGGDSAGVRGAFDELYASEDWATLTSLWAISDRVAADDAFRVHFFNPYRSALERSLNHPLVGIYPLSWAYKAAREWMRFLYANQTIAGLRLGMTPAVALNHIVRAQNATFAQTNQSTLEEYVGLKGPLGSTFLIFNLILPGDWSSIPFPASRTVRDLLRKGPSGALLGLPDQVGRIGLGRDARLLIESAGEIGDLIYPEMANKKSEPLPWEPLTGPGPITIEGRPANR